MNNDELIEYAIRTSKVIKDKIKFIEQGCDSNENN